MQGAGENDTEEVGVEAVSKNAGLFAGGTQAAHIPSCIKGRKTRSKSSRGHKQPMRVRRQAGAARAEKMRGYYYPCGLAPNSTETDLVDSVLFE